MPEPTAKTAPEKPPRKPGTRAWKRLRRLFTWLLILPITLFLVLQIPAVQDAITNWTADYLSETLDARVEIGRARVSWLDELSIEGILIEDKYRDTLLFGERIAVDFDVLGGLYIESVLIEDTRFKIRRDLGDPESNLTTALNKLFPPKPNSPAAGNPLNFQLDRLDLRRVAFVQNDSVKGQRWDVELESGVVDMDEIDLVNKIIEIDRVELRAPTVRQTNIQPSPIPEALLRLDSVVQAAIDTTAMTLLAGSIEVINGAYVLNNFRKDAIEEADISAVDFARLGTRNVDLEMVDAKLRDYEFTAALKHLSLEERSGFTLDRLSVQDLKITPTELQLYDLELVTTESKLSDSLRFTFNNGWDAWTDFNDEVRMDINVQESEVAVRDILYFARKLRFNQFFRDNQREKIRIGGEFRGKVNNLRGRDVYLALDGRTSLAGSFGSRNLARPGSEALNLDLRRLNTNVPTLRRLISGFRPPENFDRLGNLRFAGRFDGFFTDFVATGDLRTDIGRTEFNMAMVLHEDRPAEYSGQLALDGFDLGVWTGNPQFGRVTFNGAVTEGVGLDPERASADLAATVTDFTFREYRYENAVVNGRLEKSFFNGEFNIADDNIDLNFVGEIDFRDSLPVYDFDARVGRLDLTALNLSNRNLGLSGNVDISLVGRNFAEMEGRVELGAFDVRIDTVVTHIDTLLAYSRFDSAGRKVVALESDLARGEITGRFDLDEVGTSVTGYLNEFYPEWARRLNVAPPRRERDPNRFSFDLDIIDSRGLNRLITPSLGPLVDVQARGSYDGFAHEVKAELLAPEVYVDNLRMKNVVVRLRGDGDEGELDLAVDSTFSNGKPLLTRVTLLSLVDPETVDFGITYGGREDNPLVSKINLDGVLSLPDSSNFELRFDESSLNLFSERWIVNRGNYIVFGPKYIDTRNFALRSGRRRIELANFGERGLEMRMKNLSLGLIDSVWNYPPLDFSGDVDLRLTVADVFRQQDIRAEVRSDTFLMNGDDYGYLAVDLRAPTPEGRLTAFMNLNRDTAQLIAEATYNLGDIPPSPPMGGVGKTEHSDFTGQGTVQTTNAPPPFGRSGGNTTAPRPGRGTSTAAPASAPNTALDARDRKGFLDLKVNVSGYPLELSRYWVGGSVSDIEGAFDAELTATGPTQKLDVGGYIEATNGALTIDYLQTRYRFARNRVKITNTLFDLAGGTLRDELGNTARLSGGVTHERLKNLGLNARIDTDRFLALDLQPGDNPLYFGRALGRGRVLFTGDFRQTDIYVNATVGPGSKLSIPVSYGSEAGPIDNVRFVDRDAYGPKESNVAAEPTGVSLRMDLTVTDEAVGEIIFDEEVGDILRGRGNGNLQLNIPRDGELQMFGDYNITAGSYLFTFQRIVNKEFSVRPGGKVRWSGDPFEATLDIEADYENLKTPIFNFIQEYLVTAGSPTVVNNASQATDVDLTLKLNGLLTSPDINFDLSFPTLDGQLETFANNKRRLLLLDQNELNRQVFGLIVAGQFLPSDLSFGISDAAINTVSEWLSNYFALLVNDLVKDAFGEDAFISGFEFDFAYNSYRNSGLTTTTDGRSSALEFTIRRDFNNRLSVTHDLNVFNNNQLSGLGVSGTFVGNDFAFEYILNESRTLTLRFYERLEPDITGASRFQVGTGLSWRREFDSLEEFFDGFRKGAGGRR